MVITRSAEPAPGQFDSLVKNSPFGQPAPVTGPQAGNEASALEFRGVFADNGEYFFSLHETASRSSQWVGLKESGQPYLVESYDSAKGSIQVKYRNQVMALTLKRAQVVVQAMPSPVMVSPAVPSPTGLPIASNSTPTDEARRLTQVAEEIRRRRALRAQGPMPQPNPGGGSPANLPYPGGGPSPNPPLPVRP